ncbi:MAG: HEAT repeat domain-containing protein [Saprospiraceae bacterium]|nr:HEAT repeat domain-containing protein [Saprospiraceae bacterium]
MQRQFEKQQDSYLKAAAIKGMGYYERMYIYLGDLLKNTQDTVVRTAIVEALKNISESKRFDALFGLGAAKANFNLGQLLVWIASKQRMLGRWLWQHKPCVYPIEIFQHF